MSASRIRVLVVDDTALYRKILAEAVAQVPDMELAGSAASGAIALKRLGQGDIELVLLDVVMPEMDGVQTLAHIRRTSPGVAVVLVSGVTGRDADVTVSALANGALEFIAKPQASSYAEAMQRLVGDLRRVVQVLAIRRLAARSPAPSPSFATSAATAVPPQPARPQVRMNSPRPVHLILIGVSTGGPKALHEVLPSLPSTLPVPVLIVQHMPPLFTRSLADQLSRVSRIPVREAADGDAIKPGLALLAPGGRHLTVALQEDRRTFKAVLSDAPPVHSCRPSVDVLFQSVAQSGFSGGIATVILTGMGEDGANGVASLRPMGAWSIAQDQATSVVYGMPEAIARRQLADEILPLPAIGPRLAALPFARPA
jgi:two-component system chemotaxis response regulator CheB